MNKKVRIIPVFVIIVLLIGVVYGKDKNFSKEDIDRFELEEQYYIGEVQKYNNYIIELSYSMYSAKLKAGFCIFEVKEKNGSVEKLSKFPQGVTVKGTGSIGSDTEICKDRLLIYVSFSMCEFSEGYEDKIWFEFCEGEVVEFDLYNTISEELEVNYGDKDEIVISPIGIWVARNNIETLKLIYKNGEEEYLIRNGTLKESKSKIQSMGEGMQISIDNPSEEIKCDEIESVVINEVEVDAEKQRFYSNYLSSFSQEDISYGLTTTQRYYKNYDSAVETKSIFLSKNVSLIKDTIGDNYDYGKEMVIEAQIYVDGTEYHRVLLLRKNDDGDWYVDSEK